MALVIVIGLELVVAIQPLVFVIALPTGLVIGWYAGVRSARRRPWWRVLANAAYAGVLTAIGLTVLYVALRLLFVYADSGYRDGNQGGPLACTGGPDCSYQRYLAAKQGPVLAAAGVHDAASFEQWFLRGQLQGGLALLVITAGGAILGGIYYAVRPERPPDPGATPAA
ncbi:MAG: hypothetical protein ACRDGL_08125 [Candidatus Limnocylindrales bacterium]